MSQTDVARPENPAPLAESAIYDACKAFVLAYALPALLPEDTHRSSRNSESPWGSLFLQGSMLIWLRKAHCQPREKG